MCYCWQPLGKCWLCFCCCEVSKGGIVEGRKWQKSQNKLLQMFWSEDGEWDEKSFVRNWSSQQATGFCSIIEESRYFNVLAREEASVTNYWCHCKGRSSCSGEHLVFYGKLHRVILSWLIVHVTITNAPFFHRSPKFVMK